MDTGSGSEPGEVREHGHFRGHLKCLRKLRTEWLQGRLGGSTGRPWDVFLFFGRSLSGIFRSGTEEGQGKALTAEELITGEMRQEFGGSGQWQNPQGKS